MALRRSFLEMSFPAEHLYRLYTLIYLRLIVMEAVLWLESIPITNQY